MEKFVRKGHEGVTFFVGNEIEQTPAFNKKTLFVVGLQNTETIEKLAKEHNVKHVFLSANRSFDSIDKVNGEYKVGYTNVVDWETQIQHLLDSGYMVSLDYPAHKHAMVLDALNKNIWQSRNFVPVLSVAVPNVNTSNPNLTIKIDDINFGATNPGVWCLNHNEVTDSNRFTSWSEYGDDVVIELGQEERRIHYIDVGDFPPEKAADMIAGVVDAMNNTNIGLDPVSKSSLKLDAEVQVDQKPAVVITTPVDAAEAYAEGTTKDPLSAKESTKAIKPKAGK